VNYSDLVIVVHPQVQAKTLQEFIAARKSQAGQAELCFLRPGYALSHGGELFKTMAGIDVVHVPYRTAAQAQRSDGGQVTDDDRRGSGDGAKRY